MMRSLFSGVSGLKNHQTRMDVIGNNISNVNTTGFKSGRVTFTDTLSQTLTGASKAAKGKGGTNPKQVGLGSVMSSIDTIFTNGSVQSTGKNTDLCLSGSGLFIVNDPSGTYYTRNGAFEFDEAGNYVLPGSGMFVQGWMAKDGVLPESCSDGNMENIVIPAGKLMASKATKEVKYTKNLDASTPLIKEITITKSDGTSVQNAATVDFAKDNTIASATLKMSDGSTQVVTSGRYTKNHGIPVATTITVYDSLGAEHIIPLNIEKTDKNEWLASLAKTKIEETDGNVTELNMSDVNITFTESGMYKDGMGKITMTAKNGAKEQEIAVNFTGLTQFSGSSTVNAAADGNAAGSLSSVSVDASGIITGTYTNGIVQYEAQVAVAQFNNPAGLTKTGNSLYQKSNNSGTATVSTAADLGVTITPSALEMSNVDVANEFSDMIITQRGFQSNSKIITVSDEMLETLINMKR
ncbi:MAG: flagellar hook protein FlgE [Selenomonadaceae bacterium]